MTFVIAHRSLVAGESLRSEAAHLSDGSVFGVRSNLGFLKVKHAVARGTHLAPEVAIKVLPADFGQNLDQLQRNEPSNAFISWARQ